MRVLLATAAEAAWSRALRTGVEALARADRYGEHVVVEDPREADLILFLDPHQHPGDWSMRSLRKHPLVKRFPDKVFVYDERDVPRDVFPGVYVSMPRSTFSSTRHRAFGYCFLLNDTRGIVNPRPDLLFSFQGRRAGDTRTAVLALTHSRAVIEDTSEYDFFGSDPSAVDKVMARYREIIGRSKFVLCPRGAGTSSLRLFEALACGRVPVVLSDEWTEPQGIDWASCSVRIPERDAATVPDRLEILEPHWPRMSRAARDVHDDWFASDVWFHRLIEHCRELQEIGQAGLRRPWMSPAIWRDGARHLKRRL